MFLHLLVALGLAASVIPAHADQITVAAASDLKFALTDIRNTYVKAHPDASIDLIFGSSGNFTTQIKNGAPYDVFFSADIVFPQQIETAGFAAAKVTPYAIGRVVLWQTKTQQSLTLTDLTKSVVKRVAIANPQHAPYGMRAVEALKSAGVWLQVEPKLVLGENIAQAAQFVESGAADAGIVALALVTSPALAGKGVYTLIDETMHNPLQQGFIITRYGAGKILATRFTEYTLSPDSIATLKRYGFTLPAR